MPPKPPPLDAAAPPAPLLGPSSPQPTMPLMPAAGQSAPDSKTSRALGKRRSLGTGRSIPHPSRADPGSREGAATRAWPPYPHLPRGATQGIGSPAAPPAPAAPAAPPSPMPSTRPEPAAPAAPAAP